jgi:hypothetical protein
LIVALSVGIYLYAVYRSPSPEVGKRPVLLPSEERTEKAEEPAVDTGHNEPVTIIQEAAGPEMIPEEKELPPPVIETAIEPLIEPASGVTEHVLTGIVSMRTYVKIYVDDNPPKEFIFQPGARPQWTAREGFDVVVGNAAGIEFEFDGERRGNLGKPDSVVRIGFPEDFKSSLYED